jgi:D-alanyl-D-alanine carboxypeptidase
VFAALKAGQITSETRIPVSEAANAQPPSKIGLPVGADMSVDTAIQALIVKSANDVAVMLAEAVGGSEESFVDRMNRTATALGMTRTHYVNANGLPAPEQITTARDLAKLSRAVLKDFPQYARLWSLPEFRLGKIRIHTHNGLLRAFEGADGMKTGFICDSGYNVVASATRDGTRMIAVVLGESSSANRNIRAQSLLEHGFRTFGWKTLFNAATLDNLPPSPEMKGVASIRNTVMATECGYRRPRAVASSQKAKQAKAKAAVTAEGSAADTPAKPPAKPKAVPAPKEADASAKTAPRPAAAPQAKAADAQPKPKPKPKAAEASP